MGMRFRIFFRRGGELPQSEAKHHCLWLEVKKHACKFRRYVKGVE